MKALLIGFAVIGFLGCAGCLGLVMLGQRVAGTPNAQAVVHAARSLRTAGALSGSAGTERTARSLAQRAAQALMDRDRRGLLDVAGDCDAFAARLQRAGRSDPTAMVAARLVAGPAGELGDACRARAGELR